MADSDTFPRQYARTRRFTLGEPRTITVSSDGSRIVFLRSRSGVDPVNVLWTIDAGTGAERVVADPSTLLSDLDEADLPAEERARRERVRESGGGITSYATDDAVAVTAFTIAGRLFVASLVDGTARELAVAGPVFDPRPDPLAQRVAYVSGRLLCVGELDGTWRVLAGDDPDEPDTVSWGSAEFVAAEEMDRQRGFWWSPDGTTIAACRVDVAAVPLWTIADPSDPASPPVQHRYPSAGSENADVRLFLLPLDRDEQEVEVRWDRDAFPYLADVRWDDHGLALTLQSRDQRTLAVVRADPDTGNMVGLFADEDEQWVELVPGSPRHDHLGRLVVCADRDDARRLLVGGAVTTPADQQVRAVLAATESGIVYTANPVTDATVQHVWRLLPDGSNEALTDEPGVHSAVCGGETVVIRSATLDEFGTYTATLGGVVIESFAETPLVHPEVHLLRSSRHELATAVLVPSDGSKFDGALPVLLDPYGGPHALRVLAARAPHLTSQWFADQGFVVVVTDGRGTPGRGHAWERAVHGDLATAPLDDQVEGLEAAAAWLEQQDLGMHCDLDRVAIRGWSFGGYLAALAVLRRPDVFHAAIAGAPVTEMRLYDTHYTERYLGDPGSDPGPYDASSLLPIADQLTRPLLIIHGLADDNVVAAHTLRLSSALLAAGKPHEVLPLVGVTHMTPQEVVAENLLLHQLDFLRRSLP